MTASAILNRSSSDNLVATRGTNQPVAWRGYSATNYNDSLLRRCYQPGTTRHDRASVRNGVLRPSESRPIARGDVRYGSDRAENPRVGGSIPPLATNLSLPAASSISFKPRHTSGSCAVCCRAWRSRRSPSAKKPLRTHTAARPHSARTLLGSDRRIPRKSASAVLAESCASAARATRRRRCCGSAWRAREKAATASGYRCRSTSTSPSTGHAVCSVGVSRST